MPIFYAKPARSRPRTVEPARARKPDNAAETNSTVINVAYCASTVTAELICFASMQACIHNFLKIL